MSLGAPPVQKFFESQRLRISYWDWGNEDKPTFVFVHGGYDHARSWDRIVEAFRDDYHVVAIDLRGHGDSDAAIGSQYAIPDLAIDVVRLVEEVGAPAKIVGHSFGASTTLIAAGTFPELFDGVIVRIDGGGDCNSVHRAALPQPVKDMPQQWLAGDRHQHLARQARGAHACLDDGDDGPHGHYAGVQLSRTCLKGRKPSAGSARHSRSGSSAGTGSLKPLPSAVIA